MSISEVSATISVLRGSPYSALSARSSSRMIFITSASLARISFRRAISFSTSSYSAMILSRSRPVSRWSRISRMAWAWTSESLNSRTSPVFASSGLADALMSAITASRFSRAILRPRRIWARSSAFLRSYLVLRMTTSLRCWMKFERSFRRFSTRGWLFTEREHDHAEGGLHGRVLEQLVQDQRSRSRLS